MTLSQRLTRAGAVFILLGSVAAVLPASDSAQATTCNDSSNSFNYRVTRDSSGGMDTNMSGAAVPGSGDKIYRNSANGPTSITLYAFKKPTSSGSYAAVSVTFSLSSGQGSASFTQAASSMTNTSSTGISATAYPYVKADGTAGSNGSPQVTATFVDNSITTKVGYYISVNM